MQAGGNRLGVLDPERLVGGVVNAFGAVQLEASNARNGSTFAFVALKFR